MLDSGYSILADGGHRAKDRGRKTETEYPISNAKFRMSKARRRGWGAGGGRKKVKKMVVERGVSS